MEIKEKKEKAMIELDNVKKDIEKQRAILASFTSFANDQARKKDSTPSPHAQLTSPPFPSRSRGPVHMRPGAPAGHAASTSMVLPDLINHESSGTEAGYQPGPGRMMMSHNEPMYGSRHRPGAPGLPLPPTMQGHHVQTQMLHRAQHPHQFQNTNIHHFLPHQDPRHLQHVVPRSSPHNRVPRSSPIAIAPAPAALAQTQTSASVATSIPEVRRPSTGSTPESQVAIIRPRAFCREISQDHQQPPALALEVMGQQPPVSIADLRRPEVASRGPPGGQISPASNNRGQPGPSSTNIPLHARPAYYNK